MKGMQVAQVRLLFSFSHATKVYPCAFVEWFKIYGSHPDTVTGLWHVVPEFHEGRRLQSVIHLDTMLRNVHLLPVFGRHFLPVDFLRADTLDSFAAYE